MTSTPQPSASPSREAMEIVRRAVACICIHCEGGPCPGRCQPQRDGVALAIDALVSARVEAKREADDALQAYADWERGHGIKMFERSVELERQLTASQQRIAALEKELARTRAAAKETGT